MDDSMSTMLHGKMWEDTYMNEQCDDQSTTMYGEVKNDDLMNIGDKVTTTPSVNGRAELVLRDTVGGSTSTAKRLNTISGRDGAVSNENSNGDILECTFMRGGKCKQHGILGSRSTITKKVWAKKRDGTYAYQFKKTVKYECNIGKSIPVITRETSEHDQLGESQCGTEQNTESGDPGMSERLSGVGIRMGAANYRSESGLDYETGIERLTGPTD